MPIKRYKPTTPGRRGASVLASLSAGIQDVPHLLSGPNPKAAGRNNTGRITVRHQGGGAKRAYREIGFREQIKDVPARVAGIQYDPNRTAAVALLHYKNGQKAYMLAVKDLEVGDIVETSRSRALAIRPGNRMAVKHIPAGMLISSIELSPEKGTQVVRSAGSSATVLSVEDVYVLVKLPSGEVRKISCDALATVGQVSNAEWNLVRLGKAGRTRLRGIRPRVRGKAMNPVDHPHGGGEGGSPIGLTRPKTPWGKPALGVPTRRAHRSSDALIVRKRKKRK